MHGAGGEGVGNWGSASTCSWDGREPGPDPFSAWKRERDGESLCFRNFQPLSKVLVFPGVFVPLGTAPGATKAPHAPKGRMEREADGSPGPCSARRAGGTFPEPGSGNLVCLFAVQC